MASLVHNELTHQGWIMHIYSSVNWTILVKKLLVRSQAIIWTKPGLWSVVPIGTKFNWIFIYNNFLSRKWNWKCCLQNGCHLYLPNVSIRHGEAVGCSYLSLGTILDAVYQWFAVVPVRFRSDFRFCLILSAILRLYSFFGVDWHIYASVN